MNQLPNQSPIVANSAGAAPGIRNRFGGKRILMLAGAAAVAVVVLALTQRWLTVANLVPLLFVLPCVAMMFMCAKGHHGGYIEGDGRDTAKGPENTGPGRD